ncbi:Trp biosynthesis-associated membrane protein [Frankia sp. AgB32]|uniref:Trp biosynthesis-associated membrane protein n=1 Tax=Frankia sp. AgB32 TaxID=631119 RepID=UPI00200CFB72|nr:Trp biosynthesis-associated membrane protein [Frankia sp. AgB32]MCK9894547.1 Trp biosynthesis-associated membrane protein [Frankia sp. AgB32]
MSAASPPPTSTGTTGQGGAPGTPEEARAARLGRRERGLAILGCLVGAGLVLTCGAATWASARVGAPRSPGDGDAVAAPLAAHWSGGTLAPACTALALVGLAAAVAIVATRRVGRTVVGVLAVAAGIGIIYLAGRVGADPLAAVRDTDAVEQFSLGGRADISEVHRTAAPWLAVIGGALLTVAGMLAAVRGGRWPAMSGRYQAREARPVDAWDAIERGHDPT